MSWTLVTGGARNTGAAICRALAEQGHHVVIHYKTSQKEAEALAQELDAELIQGSFDSSHETRDFVERYLARFPQTQALVNNVGNYLVSPPSRTAITDWEALFQSNLFAPIAITQALLPSLKETQGRIINLGVAGLQRQFAETYSTAYTASKDALWRYTCSLASEMAPHRVTVNMVSPGILKCSVDQPINQNELPMKRLGTEEELAALINYLMSPAADYITGQNIEVAGGLRLR